MRYSVRIVKNQAGINNKKVNRGKVLSRKTVRDNACGRKNIKSKQQRI